MAMRKFIATALASVTAAGAVMATAAPAQADDYRHYRHHKRGGGNDAAAAAIIGGVAGLALGAALSNGARRDGYDNGYRYDRRGYSGYGYDYRYDRPYARSYGYGYGDRYGYYERPRYRTCVSRDRVWDPYIGRRVTIERSYAC